MTNAIYLIESNSVAKAAIRAHIKAKLAQRKEIQALVDDLRALGAETSTYSHWHDGRPTGFHFVSGRPSGGWTKPDSRGNSRPKRGTEWAQRMDAISVLPDPSDTIAKLFTVPRSVRYRSKDGGEGWREIGNPLAECGWLYLSAQGPFAFYIPDIDHVRATCKARGERPFAPVSTFNMKLAGCRRLLPEEWELMVAQHNLAKAKKAQK